MPLQHIDESMLGRMRRETSRQHIEDLVVRLRAGIPGVALRTTFIVGFPGRDGGGIRDAARFYRARSLRAARNFQILARRRLARGEDAGPDSDPREKRALSPRHASAAGNRAGDRGTGTDRARSELLVDQPLVARSQADAPDVDTTVVLAEPAPVGEFIRRTIIGTRGYDLLA